MVSTRWVGRLVVLLALMPTLAAAQSADNVLVVINNDSPISVQIGEYYARKRAVAQDHVLRIKTATTEGISRPDYNKTIEGPVADWLMSKGLLDKVLYLVLTKGVPLRVEGTGGLDGSVASVDSELTVLYRKLVGSPAVSIVGRIPNPYFLDQKPVSEAKPFTRFDSDIYLVTRLDGFTVEDVLKLIDKGAAPTTAGQIVLDQRANLLDAGGDRWLQEAADRLRNAGAGDRVFLEMTRSLATTDGPVLGYYSWGSNDPSNHLRHFGLQFAPGAIAAMFVSTDGRTFLEPPADWQPGAADRKGFGAQTLAGDLIRDGVTGIAAHVTEPYLDATIRPQILFPAYLAGFNLAESFYLAMPFLSWETVVIGDPLCSPFEKSPVPADRIAKGVDPDTTLPSLFSERRVAVLTSWGANTQAVKLSLHAEREIAAGNDAEAEKMLTDAYQLEPRLSVVGLRLAEFADARKEHAKAIEIYRKILDWTPDNVVVLNNLAYDLAEFQHNPEDALPIAEKAYGLAREPTIADTLAWIHHLLGNELLARPLIEQALLVKDSADIQMHAAFIHEAFGDVPRARTELETALKLDPSLADRADVKTLKGKLK